MTEIFTNAAVTTMDEDRPKAEAFAVRDGVFTFVGSREEAQEYARRLESEGESVTFTDLSGGACSLPSRTPTCTLWDFPSISSMWT